MLECCWNTTGNILVEKFYSNNRLIGIDVIEPDAIFQKTALTYARQHHIEEGNDHNRFTLSQNGRDIGVVAVSLAGSSGMLFD